MFTHRTCLATFPSKFWFSANEGQRYQSVRLLKMQGARIYRFRSCFYRTFEGDVIGEKVFDPEDAYE
jgi:hypothetical protein